MVDDTTMLAHNKPKFDFFRNTQHERASQIIRKVLVLKSMKNYELMNSTTSYILLHNKHFLKCLVINSTNKIIYS